jgi:hypothetical protein
LSNQSIKHLIKFTILVNQRHIVEFTDAKDVGLTRFPLMGTLYHPRIITSTQQAMEQFVGD